MEEHVNEKYVVQEETHQNVNETAAAYDASIKHVQLAFDLPHNCDVESFRLLMSVYARHLIENSAEIHKRVHSLSDEQLEKELAALPSFDGHADTEMSVLTKDDYSHFMRSRKPIKGISKWL